MKSKEQIATMMSQELNAIKNNKAALDHARSIPSLASDCDWIDELKQRLEVSYGKVSIMYSIITED